MQAAPAILFQLGAQLVLGGLFYGAGSLAAAWAWRQAGRDRRRLRLAWRDAGRCAWPLLPWAVALGLAGAVVAVATGAPLARASWPSSIPFLLSGAVPAASAWLALCAGRLERAGRVRSARRLARLGGQLMFVGCLVVLIVMWVDLLFRPSFRVAIVRDDPRAALLLVTSMLGFGLAGFLAGLGGLAGKPRPAGALAALLYVLAFSCAILSADRVRHAVDPLSYGRTEAVAALPARLGPQLFSCSGSDT